ncbi:LysE family transporter [Embleya sp. NBC_00896]|uniref:LysE family transporter n=1 Tax=Embleya sp. NBC_00896 TaxID=2975961 RepID=UPI003869D2A5
MGLFAAFGPTALLAASEPEYDVVRIVGAVVPVWFGAQMLRAARRGEEVSVDEAAAAVRSGFPSYWGGLLLSLGNRSR